MSKASRIAILLNIILVSGLAHARPEGGTSVLFLPGHIEAPDGQVTLFADYGSIRTDGRVPVYLVNRTGEPLTLNAQDGDIYIKLEYRDDDGNWIRAQPHGYSWCGNSYTYKPVVDPDHYIATTGYQPINGETRRIRYRLYEQSVDVVSNLGTGVIAEVDLLRAANDVLSINQGDFAYVSRVARSREPVENVMDHMRDLRGPAISELGSGRFDVEASRAILLEIRDGSPELARDVHYALQRLGDGEPDAE